VKQDGPPRLSGRDFGDGDGIADIDPGRESINPPNERFAGVRFAADSDQNPLRSGMTRCANCGSEAV
jgi:hypothetical protein